MCSCACLFATVLTVIIVVSLGIILGLVDFNDDGTNPSTTSGPSFGDFNFSGFPDMGDFDLDNFDLSDMFEFGPTVSPTVSPTAAPTVTAAPTSIPVYGAWRTDKNEGGLDLTIINALTDDWQPFFEQSVSDWDNGQPDAITLTTTTYKQNNDGEKCDTVPGRLVVCNGDYGATGWDGVNESVLYSGNRIDASVSRMNEYYLSHASDAKKQYTMCHEMGHAWGLGHPDENFFNEDLGTCMDYTNRPQNNQGPSDSNFNQLSILYGYNKNGGRKRDLLRKRTAASAEDATITTGETTQNTTAVTHHLFDGDASLLDAVNNIVLPRFKSFVDTPSDERRSLWRLLRRHDSNRGEVYEMDLGGGYSVRAYLLLHDEEEEGDE